MRADIRVKRAAKLAAKTYLDDVSMMVEKVNLKKKRCFDRAVTKKAHKEINGRQCARLEMIKA